jgi:phosphoribosylanthranilate isomerase
MHRTRIKICGLTRVNDLRAAVAEGADAIGLVFYPHSPRYLAPQAAGEMIASLPAFVATVGLFVNATLQEVASTLEHAPVSCLQFHGDETLEQCCEIAHALERPFLRAVRIGASTGAADLLECDAKYRSASSLFAGLLLDAMVEGYGGGGKVFDWSLIPEELAPRVVLSGGLSVQNAADAVRRVRPHAVDVSSGVELSKGVKDPAKIRHFIEAVREADTSLNQ